MNEEEEKTEKGKRKWEEVFHYNGGGTRLRNA
jgi:hypothetical protein